MLRNITTILFDLDGTLYQDNTFYKEYLRRAVWHTPFENSLGSITEYVAKTIRCETVPLNRFYRLDLPPVREVAALPAAMRDRLLPGGAWKDTWTRDPARVCYLGDMWALVQLLAHTLGLLGGTRANEIFIQTRQHMEAQGFSSPTRLVAAVEALRPRYKTLLMSNSFEATARGFIAALGYNCDQFDYVVYDAKKPFHLYESLEKAAPGILANPGGLLSIGDHVFNDLMPIKEIGGRTVWMNPFVCAPKPDMCDVMLHTTDELALFLEQMKKT